MFERERSEAETHDSLSREERLVWLMEEYGKSVVRLAYTYVRQKQLAEDIAQEVFIKCYKNMDMFRRESSYKTWIYRITVNKCKDVMKSWAYKNVLFTNIFSPKWNRSEESTESRILINEESLFISEMVVSLPIILREVIILHYYEELQINEIADLLELNQNTVKSRLHRARLKLKKMLDGGKHNG
ncbi:sigma-70 family RNA polymerase sigma factor [Bacillus sp. V3-13]|uniref:sigma-70 family RNA polymerase sigma factor n=1 Tax=Bacillus sp. V3-13 TaxID=2053728 RepID=UPI001156FF3B|nr:sigma-70 family RNA polymerase sigma factor [Bacillus sp. V3-13]